MFFLADFGAAYAGLATVGYAQHKADGTAVVARTTTGVVALGNGSYGVEVTPNSLAAAIKWDTGGASPIYAHEAITPYTDLSPQSLASIASTILTDPKMLTVAKFLGLK